MTSERRVRLALALCALALALGAAGLAMTSAAIAAAGDGVCTVIGSPLSNVVPTAVILTSSADDDADSIGVHASSGPGLLVRDPGGDGTSALYVRTVPASVLVAVGDENEDLTFVMPPANIAGEFEVLTEATEASSDCTSGVSGVFDGLSVAQERTLLTSIDSLDGLDVVIRGTSDGVPLEATTTVTLSTSIGEFVTVNDLEIKPTRVVQLRLTGAPVEGAAVGQVLWRPRANEQAGSGTITATATQGAQSMFKSVTASIAPAPTLAGNGFSGILPEPGNIGLLVTSAEQPTTDLVLALVDAGCLAATLAMLDGGEWQIYVPGAPDTVNAEFPQTLPEGLPFFLRCIVGREA